MSDKDKDREGLKVGSLGHCFFCLKKIPKKKGQVGGNFYSLANLSFWFGGFRRFNILETHKAVLKHVKSNSLEVELCERCEGYKCRIDDFVRSLEEAVVRVKVTAGVIKEIIEKADAADLDQATVELSQNDLENFAAFSKKTLDLARKEVVRKCDLELQRDFSKFDFDFTGFKDAMGKDDYVPVTSKVPSKADATIPPIPVVKAEKSDPITDEKEKSASSKVISAKIKTEPREFEEAWNDLFAPANPSAMETAANLQDLISSMDTDATNETLEQDVSNAESVSAPMNIETIEAGHNSEFSNLCGEQFRPREESTTQISSATASEQIPREPPNSVASTTPNYSPSLPFQEIPLINPNLGGHQPLPKRVKGLKLHYIQIPGSEKVKCKQCEKVFNKVASFRYHFRVKHLGVRYSCQKCSASFTAPNGLVYHEKRCGMPGF